MKGQVVVRDDRYSLARATLTGERQIAFQATDTKCFGDVDGPREPGIDSQNEGREKPGLRRR